MILLKLAICAAIFLAGAAGGIKFQSGLIAQRDLAANEAQAKATARRVDRIDNAAVAFESDKAKIRTEFLTITKEVERVIQNPVYRDVCLDADGLRIVNASINPATPASQPAPALSGLAGPE